MNREPTPWNEPASQLAPVAVRRTALIVALAMSAVSLPTSGVAAQLTAIEAGGHPNLYFDQDEIDAMRHAILVDRAPAYAVETYESLRGTGPAHFPPNLNSLPWRENYEAGRATVLTNMKACFSFMIEPTEDKARALRDALLSWTDVPNRGWCHDAQGAGHAQYALAWMYDLIHDEGVLSDDEKARADDFFSDMSRVLAFSAERWASTPSHSVTAEGSYRESYENWWQLAFHAGLVFALVSHDQSAVDRLFVTSVPEDHFVTDMSAFGGDTRSVANMINGLVFPSGQNFDGYHRNLAFEGEHYHFFALMPAAIGAEAAAHNGFDGWGYRDQALLRTFRVGAEWAGEARRGDASTYNWTPFFWVAYRRYPTDAVVREMVESDRARGTLPWIFDSTLPLWGVLGDLDVNAPTPSPELSISPPTNLRVE